jgi:pimeloyl-ACP methyl ester carboxylesterase
MKRIAVAASAAVIVILAGCGGGAAKHAAPKHVAPKHDKAISRSFRLGGRSLFLQCTGSGRPTVVMEAGMGNGHDAWDTIAPRVSKLTRTCTYDRAGEGISEYAGPRTAQDIVSDLRRLLARAGVAPPYVLVAHSWGGIDVRLYAGEHPRDVVGLVLLDTTPTTLLDDACTISKAICDTYVSSWAWQSNPEGVRFERSAHEVEATRLPQIPLIVMTATNHEDGSFTARQNRRFEALWEHAQKRVAASVAGGRLEVVKGGHGIQDEHPRAVVAAISAVLRKAR